MTIAICKQYVDLQMEKHSMTDELTPDKISDLIEHWIEHNNSHIKSFNTWADTIEHADFNKTAMNIISAAKKIDESNEYLKKALKEIHGEY